MAPLRFAFSILAALSVSVACAAQSPVIDTMTPDSVIYKPVPQPTITITGSNLVVGIPSQTNRPTLTITHTDLPGVSFSAMMSVNFSGTQATLPAGDNAFNMLQMPLGIYDLTLSRPDKESVTIPGGFSIITEPDPAPGSIEMRVASYWGGPITGMDLSPDGSLAYIANGRMLRILDISDESNPTELGSIYLTGVNDVKVRDGYAFVAASSVHGFCVVDVSDPASPELMWVGSGGGKQTEVRGNYAYVAGLSGSSINVWNISDPLNVLSAGSISANAGAFAIANDRLYVGRDAISHHLNIYDLAADPVNPPLLGTLEAAPGTQGNARAIAVEGNHAYVAVWTGQPAPLSSLLTIDVSNPASPELTHVFDELHFALDVAIHNGHLLLADSVNGAGNEPSSAKGIAVFDVTTDPAVPALVAAYKPQPNGNPRGVHVAGSRAYSFDDAEGLIILDITTATDPTRLGNYHSPSTLKQMAKSGDQLFVADWYGGFTILDVSDPISPVVTGTYQAQTWDDIGFAVEGLAVQDNVAFISLRNRGLDAVDVSELSNPTLISNLFPPPPNWGNNSYLGGVTVSGNVAHLGFYDQITSSSAAVRHLTVDVSDASNMFEIARSEHMGVVDPADCIVLHGSGIAFTADDSYGAKMIDVTNPATPHQVGEIVGIGELDVALVGDTLFLASHPPVPNNRGLHIFDVSSPLSPAPLGHIHESNDNAPTCGNSFVGKFDAAYAVDVQNDRAYVVANAGGAGTQLFLFDVTDPSNPECLDRTTGGSLGHSQGTSILVDEPNAYVTKVATGTSDIAWGLAIVNVHGLPEAEPDCLADLVSSATFQPPGDGQVDAADLAYLLGEWGRNPGSLADIVTSATFQPPPDGIVDGADLAFLLGAWGGCE